MKLIIIAAFFMLPGIAYAQNTSEWMDQDNTQRKYLIEQISAIHVFLEFAQMGYRIADRGLTDIKKIKNGDFKLHEVFFDRLSMVNPSLKKYVDLASIISIQLRLMTGNRKTLRFLRNCPQISNAEIKYFEEVLQGINTQCIADIDALLIVLKDGQLGLNDDARLKRICSSLESIRNSFASAVHFGQESRMLALRRLNEKSEMELSRRINSVK